LQAARRRQRLRSVRGRRRAPQLTRSVLPPLLERARLPRLLACKRAHDGAAALFALSRVDNPSVAAEPRQLPLHKGAFVGKDCALFADGAERRSSHAPFCLLFLERARLPRLLACKRAHDGAAALFALSRWDNPSAGRSAATSPYTGEAGGERRIVKRVYKLKVIKLTIIKTI